MKFPAKAFGFVTRHCSTWCKIRTGRRRRLPVRRTDGRVRRALRRHGTILHGTTTAATCCALSTSRLFHTRATRTQHLFLSLLRSLQRRRHRTRAYCDHTDGIPNALGRTTDTRGRYSFALRRRRRRQAVTLSCDEWEWEYITGRAAGRHCSRTCTTDGRMVGVVGSKNAVVQVFA